MVILNVLFDANALVWAARGDDDVSSPSLLVTLDALVAFMRSYLIMNPVNEIVLHLAGVGRSKSVAWRSGGDDDGGGEPGNEKEAKNIQSDLIANLPHIKEQVYATIDEFMRESEQSATTTTTTTTTTQHVAWSATLSHALCFVNKQALRGNSSRILILSVSPDVSSQYIPIMNCIFTAQTMRIPIDAAILSSHDVTFLQQATHLTGGVYHRLEVTGEAAAAAAVAVAQRLVAYFLPPATLRIAALRAPAETEIDYRAACFCHRRLIDIGYVCSICLSIYCRPQPSCATCDVRFTLPQL